MKLSVQQLATTGGAAPLARSGHGAAVVNGDTLVVIGGEQDDLCLGDAWAGKISANSMAWTRVATEGSDVAAHPRMSLAAAAHGSRVLTFGGVRDGYMDLIESLGVLDLGTAGGAWTLPSTSGAKPSRRMHLGLTVGGDVVYLHGGFDGVQHLNDLYSLDLRTNTWTCLAPHDDELAHAPRSQHQLCYDSGCLVALGGELQSSSSSSDAPAAARFDLAAGRWRDGPSAARASRRSCAAACLLPAPDGEVCALVVGGYGERDIASEPLMVPITSLDPRTVAHSGSESLAWAGASLSTHVDSAGKASGLLFGGWDGVFQRSDFVTRLSFA